MWEELKTFIEVVEQQSFTKAAQKLNISQPTVSLHIRRLEECFNAVLIRRSKKQKQLSVTYAGMIVYDAAKQEPVCRKVNIFYRNFWADL